jgi:acetoacetate decarboxylase
MHGKLTKDKMAPAMPVNAPAYGKKPFYYKNARWLVFEYETEKLAAAELLPQPLVLTKTPTAGLVFAEYDSSTLGPYLEVIQTIKCKYGEEELFYIPHLYLNREAPILAGRELFGFPKKAAHIEIFQEEDLIAGHLERPRGFRLASGVARLEKPLGSQSQENSLGVLTLRVIPAPEPDKDLSLVELLRVNFVQTHTDSWAGVGSCSFTGASVLDPVHALPITKMRSTVYTVFDGILSHAQVLETL